MKHSLETYVYSHYNMCNIPIYFCNIDLQHLQHTSKTLETIAICTFSVASACCLDEWRLVDAELDVGAELDAMKWRGGRWCGARRWHGPRQGQGNADGARPQWEARFRAGARSTSGRRGHGRGRAMRVGAAWLSAGSSRSRGTQCAKRASDTNRRKRADDLNYTGPDGQTTYKQHFRIKNYRREQRYRK
jgi:hypothetical protein